MLDLVAEMLAADDLHPTKQGETGVSRLLELSLWVREANVLADVGRSPSFPRLVATVFAALIGAFVGSIGTVAVEEWLRARRETRERREAFVRRYLFQLQDAVEALWYRVYNIRYEGGTGAMTPEYQQTTTVYALGRVLAVERVLTLEGVYPQLKKLHPKLGETLQDRPLSRKLRSADFQRYDRIALAEAVLERDEGGYRPSTYLAFQSRYVDGASGEAGWLGRARTAVGKLADDPEKMDRWLNLLGRIAHQTSAETEIPTSITEKDKNLDKPPEWS